MAALEVQADDGLLTVTAVPRDGADIGLELFSAAERTDLLSEALDMTVQVTGAT